MASWIVLWAVVIVSQFALLVNNASMDTFWWRTTRWFTGNQNNYRWDDYKKRYAEDKDAPFYYRVNPPLTRALEDGSLEARVYKRTETLWRLLRDLGEPITTLLVIILVAIYDRRGSRAAMLVIYVTAVTGLASWVLRATAGRFRPILNDGENRWQLWRGFFDTSNLSWPSGHATLAFATAAALCYLSPRGRWLFVVTAAGCAVARVVMQAHFYSDIILGSALGWTVGWMASVMGGRVLR